MWTGGGKKSDFIVDLINRWPQTVAVEMIGFQMGSSSMQTLGNNRDAIGDGRKKKIETSEHRLGGVNILD